MMFERLPFPRTGDVIRQGKSIQTFSGKFEIPEGGKWTLDYQKFYAADYAFGKIPVVCTFRDREETGFSNQEPYYVAKLPDGNDDESYDHITVESKIGSKWWYECHLVI